MTVVSVTTVLDARVVASQWLIEHLPDRFAAGIPEQDTAISAWRVPVWLSYPQLEPFGPVGELVIDTINGVRSHTPIAEMKAIARKLYESHREQIEAPIL